MKISVIDLGFNSVKLVNYIVASDNSFRTEEEFSVKARLGEGFNYNRSLSESAITRGIAALREFREVIHLKRIRNILPIATSAVREASNQHEFLRLVQKDTGFKFKVLGEEEEALYSYLGASRAIWQPEALFFDLGGGSLEMISTKDYRIKKIISLPLGALRLSEKYAPKPDGVYSKKTLVRLENEIVANLPSASDLRISKGIPLIGIGGSVRAIARYHQKLTKYPLAKLHNYVMDFLSLQSIRKNLCKLGSDQIANINVIGNKRAQSITAAAIVIENLMQKLGIKKITVSTHGLREGYLSEYLRNPLSSNLRQLDVKNTYDRIREQHKIWVLPNTTSEFMHSLLTSGIITSQEYQIFVCAKKMLTNPFVARSHINVLFELIMSEICPMLSHEDQLILALSLIYRRKPKAAARLYSAYSDVLVHYNEKHVQRVALCIDLSEIFERYKAKAQLSPSTPHKFTLKLVPGMTSFPELTIRNKIKAFELASDITLTCIIHGRQERPREIIKSRI
ncbi:MAG TPA: Ppx/GppA family phosphatase [Nitrososphaeraceae archaeon]|nr:Ppx/GppA family phosphatase [Nitrososphaeraceae archaeon]